MCVSEISTDKTECIKIGSASYFYMSFSIKVQKIRISETEIMHTWGWTEKKLTMGNPTLWTCIYFIC